MAFFEGFVKRNSGQHGIFLRYNGQKLQHYKYYFLRAEPYSSFGRESAFNDTSCYLMQLREINSVIPRENNYLKFELSRAHRS